jgi:hypothetical protein
LLRAVKDQPQLSKYVKMSGKERGRQAPDVFSSHCRPLEVFRPPSLPLPPGVAPHPPIGANGRVYREATNIVNRAKLVERWQSLEIYTHEDVLKMYMFFTVDQRHELAPEIFNQTGKFRSNLEDLVCKPASAKTDSICALMRSREKVMAAFPGFMWGIAISVAETCMFSISFLRHFVFLIGS